MTKKKELVGEFKNGGRVWRPKGAPDHVRVQHDFIIRDPGHGKAIPYGVQNLRRDEGWVSIGIDHDTASFAVNAISPVVAADGPRRVSPRTIPGDHGGCRRQQRSTRPPLEVETQQLGLRVRSEIDRRRYPDGVSDTQMAMVRLKRHDFPRRLELHDYADSEAPASIT